MSFLERCAALPRLGVGISTEYGAQSSGGLDPLALHRTSPELASFLEVGVEISKGLDADTTRWIEAGLPTTYHFLDVNLDEPEDLDSKWLDEVRKTIRTLKPAWLCGDAGLWHFGPRDRNHMLLLPPILTRESSQELATGICALRDACGLEVLPENPPGTAYVGDLHILDYFAHLCEDADTGILLDVAHLAMFQRCKGHHALTALDHFPLDRVIEMHVAGGEVRFTPDGYAFIEDTHGTTFLPETWEIFDYVVRRAKNLKAVIVEGERNQQNAILPAFERVYRSWKDAPTSPGASFA